MHNCIDKFYTRLILFIILVFGFNTVTAQEEPTVRCIDCDSVECASYPGQYNQFPDFGPVPAGYAIDTDHITTDSVMYDFNSALEHLKRTVSPEIVSEFNYDTKIYTFLIPFQSDSTVYYQGSGKYAYNPYNPSGPIASIYQYGSSNHPYKDAYPLWFATLDISDNKTENILLKHNVTYKKRGVFYTLNGLIYQANTSIFPNRITTLNGRTFIYAVVNSSTVNLRHYFMYETYGYKFPKTYFVHLREGRGFRVHREYELVKPDSSASINLIHKSKTVQISPTIIQRSRPISVAFSSESQYPKLIAIRSLTGITEISITVSGSASDASIDTSLLPTGMHTLTIYQNGQILENKKILIQ